MRFFSIDYDLKLDMNPTEGFLQFYEDGTIKTIEGSEILLEIHAKDVEEAVVHAGVGCGLVYVKYKDAPDKIICRFSMSGLKPAGEFCKIVNFYKLSGKAVIPEALEKRICEKCGRVMINEISVCVFCYSKVTVMKRALQFIRPYAKQIISTQLLSSLGWISFLLAPVFTRMLVDNHLYDQVGTWSNIIFIGFLMLMTRFFGEAITIISMRIFNKATIQVFNDMRTAAYSKLQTHSMTLFAKRTPGDLIRRIMDDTETVGEFINDLSRWILEMFLMFIVAFTILFITNWQLTLLVIVPIPIVSFLLYNFQLMIRARFERQWRKSSRVNTILHDIIKGIRTVKSFGNEKREIEKFSKANHELASISSKNEATWGFMFPPMSFIVGMGEFFILFVGGRMVLDGTLTLGALIHFTLYLGFIYGPLRWLVNAPRWIANTTTSLVKVFEILDDESEIKSSDVPENVAISGSVEFENVYFGYKSYEPVLKGINLKIKQGEMIGLVGKSGVGKSTLINLAMRLYDPNNGKVSINNTDLRSMDTSHLHENTGVVFQDSFLFAGTFLDNIAYGKPGATLDEIIAAAKAANAHDFITQSPDGYNTLIGEGGQTLSGGERQRLSIARAIIKNPELLILDEATSSLDVETEALIQESLARVTKGRTTIAIAHRLSTLRNADRLVVLDKGGVAEVGTHTELLRKKGIYYGLVMAQRQSSRKTD